MALDWLPQSTHFTKDTHLNHNNPGNCKLTPIFSAQRPTGKHLRFRPFWLFIYLSCQFCALSIFISRPFQLKGPRRQINSGSLPESLQPSNCGCIWSPDIDEVVDKFGELIVDVLRAKVDITDEQRAINVSYSAQTVSNNCKIHIGRENEPT